MVKKLASPVTIKYTLDYRQVIYVFDTAPPD